MPTEANMLTDLVHLPNETPLTTTLGTDMSRAIGILSEKNSFMLSLVVGALVILLFARKRIVEFTSPPKGDEFDFTKMLSMDTIVGRSVFLKSYFFYVVLLEILYVFVCSSKPMVLLMTSNPGDATFQGAAWPLGAALVVVGLLPSTPAIAQVEQMLRGLAQRAASIPGEFFTRVTKLSRSAIETLATNSSDYKADIRRFWKDSQLANCYGHCSR